MARRTLIPEGSFCSFCSGPVELQAIRCTTCGQPLEGDAMGAKCPNCGRVVDEKEAQCPTCGTTMPAVPVAEGESVLDELRAFRKGEGAEGPVVEVPAAKLGPTETALLAELESVWKLSEPFEQVVNARRRRLEHMDRLIAGARRRVRELEESTRPEEVREREELKKHVQDVLLERDEILKIEYGIAEMERIYRNIIATQEKELRAKEDALKERLEAFREELGKRDAEKASLVERERELERRERELAAKLTDVEARAQWRPPPREASPESEEVTKDQWLAAQREIQEALLKLRGTEGEASHVPTATVVRDLRMRVNELEEAMEKVAEEKNRLDREMTDLRGAEAEVRDVLRVLDELLGKLSDEEIERFARSDAFRRYERLLERVGV